MKCSPLNGRQIFSTFFSAPVNIYSPAKAQEVEASKSALSGVTGVTNRTDQPRFNSLIAVLRNVPSRLQNLIRAVSNLIGKKQQADIAGKDANGGVTGICFTSSDSSSPDKERVTTLHGKQNLRNQDLKQRIKIDIEEKENDITKNERLI